MECVIAVRVAEAVYDQCLPTGLLPFSSTFIFKAVDVKIVR